MKHTLTIVTIIVFYSGCSATMEYRPHGPRAYINHVRTIPRLSPELLFSHEGRMSVLQRYKAKLKFSSSDIALIEGIISKPGDVAIDYIDIVSKEEICIYTVVRCTSTYQCFTVFNRKKNTWQYSSGGSVFTPFRKMQQ